MARRYNFKALDQRTGRLERACTLLEDGEKARIRTREPDPKHPLSMPFVVGLDRAQIVKGMRGEDKTEDRSATFYVGHTASLDLTPERGIPALALGVGGFTFTGG